MADATTGYVLSHFGTHVYLGAMTTFTSTATAFTGTELDGILKVSGLDNEYDNKKYKPINKSGYAVIAQLGINQSDINIEAVRLNDGADATFDAIKTWEAAGVNTFKDLIIVTPRGATFEAIKYTVCFGKFDRGEKSDSQGQEYSFTCARSDKPVILTVTGTPGAFTYAIPAA